MPALRRFTPTAPAESPWNKRPNDAGITGRIILESVAESRGIRSRNPMEYGTHSLRRTKATLVYRRTKNLRAVQLLLGHTKLESTVRYLGIEVDDALEISEQTES